MTNCTKDLVNDDGRNLEGIHLLSEDYFPSENSFQKFFLEAQFRRFFWKHFSGGIRCSRKEIWTTKKGALHFSLECIYLLKNGRLHSTGKVLPTDFLENIFPKNLMFSIEILNYKKGLSGVYPSNTVGLNGLGYLDYFLIVFNRYWQLWPQRLAMAMEKVCSVGSTLRLFWMTQLNYTFYSDLKTTDLNGLGGRLRSFESVYHKLLRSFTN